jgi:hypothetical protein
VEAPRASVTDERFEQGEDRARKNRRTSRGTIAIASEGNALRCDKPTKMRARNEWHVGKHDEHAIAIRQRSHSRSDRGTHSFLCFRVFDPSPSRTAADRAIWPNHENTLAKIDILCGLRG